MRGCNDYGGKKRHIGSATMSDGFAHHTTNGEIKAKAASPNQAGTVGNDNANYIVIENPNPWCSLVARGGLRQEVQPPAA